MKRLSIILILLNILILLPAEEIKTKDDFLPPPPSEKALTSYLPDNLNKTGLLISTAGALGTMGLSLYTTHSTFDNGLSNPEGREIQNGIILTGTCLIGTALFTIMIDYFLNDEEKQD